MVRAQLSALLRLLLNKHRAEPQDRAAILTKRGTAKLALLAEHRPCAPGLREKG